MNEKIEAIIFDLGGVLLNLNYNLTVEAFNQIGNVNFNEVYSQAAQSELFDQLETGKISPAEFRAEVNKLYNESWSDDIIDGAWNAMLLDLPPSRIEFLKQLKSQFKIFLFSNTNAIHYQHFTKEIEATFGDANLLDRLFIKAHYSHILGKRKPHPSSFQHLLDLHDLTAERTLFIDDSIQHIEGANSIGLQTIHLTNGDVESTLNNFLQL